MNRSIRTLLIIGLALASLCSAAQQASTASGAANSSLPSQATFEGFLKQMFGWNNELSWKIVEIKPSEAAGISQATVIFSTPKGQQMSRIYVTPDQKYAFTGELAPFGADPFAITRQQLSNLNGPSRGPQNAPVTIVEFGDLECPACKAAQPNVAKLLEDEPKARLVFQNFPLPQIHKWAMTGAKYVDCLGRQNSEVAFKFIGLVYDHQEEVTEQNVDQMLKGYVKDAGGDPAAVTACTTKPDTQLRIQASIAMGEKVDVTSTPTFFVNGRRIVGFSNNSIPYDAVKAMVDYDISNPGK